MNLVLLVTQNLLVIKSSILETKSSISPFPSQWECKTDLDNAYRFGRIEVSCEGYSHPADALILKGSCGLEYTLELTEEGRRKTQGSWGSRSGFNGFGGRKMDM